MAKKILSDEDSALFRAQMDNVIPVKNDRVMLNPKTVVNEYRRESSFKGQAASVDHLLTAEDTSSFLNAGVPKSVLKKLRRGFFDIEDGLDLHGLNSTEAKRYLSQFLEECVHIQCRCVHIIHGKGYGSKNRHPVLKNEVNTWLRQHPEVEAFCSAPTNEGGTGAVLVLLFENYA